MLDLAQRNSDGPVPLEALAEAQDIPVRYLAKIIQDLRRCGLIRSVRGAHGGYKLAVPPDDIKLLDVWEALDGPLCPVDCLDRPERCPRHTECVTRDVWEQVRGAMRAVLNNTSLSDLAGRLEARDARLPEDES